MCNDSQTMLRLTLHLKAAQGACARGEPVDFESQTLQQADVQVRQRVVVPLVECQVLAVFESAARQQNGHVAVIVVGGVPQITGEEDRGLIEQTAAVVGYYQKNGNTIVDVDANQDIDKVTADVFSKLDALNG